MAKPVLAVDLGGTNVRFALVSAKGEVLARGELPGFRAAARCARARLTGLLDSRRSSFALRTRCPSLHRAPTAIETVV